MMDLLPEVHVPSSTTDDRTFTVFERAENRGTVEKVER